MEMRVQEININDIQIIENVRINIKNLQGLMQDIKDHGLKQPIGAYPTEGGKKFVLVFGNRRLEACRKLGWKKIPANLYPEMEATELLINNLAENIHRENTTPMEMGRICNRLKQEMGMNSTEISVKLNIPRSAVEKALTLYNNLPAKHRNRVAYSAPGNKRNDGSIPASVAHKILSCKRQFGLNDASIDKLLTFAKAEELKSIDMYLISRFLEEGCTVAEAINKNKAYSYTSFSVVVEKSKMEELYKRFGIESNIGVLQGIIYGEIPPLKRPPFFNPRNQES